MERMEWTLPTAARSGRLTGRPATMFETERFREGFRGGEGEGQRAADPVLGRERGAATPRQRGVRASRRSNSQKERLQSLS